jgi:hypothetical protein
VFSDSPKPNPPEIETYFDVLIKNRKDLNFPITVELNTSAVEDVKNLTSKYSPR